MNGTNHLSMIWDGQDKSKTKWGIRFKEFEMMNNLMSWNLALPQFIHNFLAMNILEGGDTSFFRYVSGANPFLYNIKEPKQAEAEVVPSSS